jgi:hypothetical protein
MIRPFSKMLKKSIETHLAEARKNAIVLDIYRTAEAIQIENPTANVALEDIIEQLILNSGANFAIEFSPAWVTRKIPLSDQSQEFLTSVEAYNA